MIDGWDKKVDYHDKFADAEKISSAWEMDKTCSRDLPSETLSLREFKRRFKVTDETDMLINVIRINLPSAHI